MKEKAKELVKKFTAKYRIEFEEVAEHPTNSFIIDMQKTTVTFDINAKQCALIAQQKEIDLLERLTDEYSSYNFVSELEDAYELKKEIELL